MANLQKPPNPFPSFLDSVKKNLPVTFVFQAGSSHSNATKLVLQMSKSPKPLPHSVCEVWSGVLYVDFIEMRWLSGRVVNSDNSKAVGWFRKCNGVGCTVDVIELKKREDRKGYLSKKAGCGPIKLLLRLRLHKRERWDAELLSLLGEVVAFRTSLLSRTIWKRRDGYGFLRGWVI